jgi:hypothetical protein
MIPVRRISAILLMALFSFSLIGPEAFAQDAGSQLPACCRRGGQHHCEMDATQPESSSLPSVKAGKCSLFPSATTSAPSNPASSFAKSSQAIFAALVGHPASRAQTEALFRISYSRASQKRGPPAAI